jgi:hypothetical protein
LAELSAIGRDYASRRELFETWAGRLRPQGIQLRLPDRYDLDLDGYAGLDGRVPPDEWRQAREMEGSLSAPGRQARIRALEAPLVASIERHEVQHRLDVLAGALDRSPPELDAVVRPDSALGHRALAELSAYVAEIERDTGTAKTNLALLARYLLDPDLVGLAESYAALVAFDGMARELGTRHDALVGPRGLDGAAVARTYLALRGFDPAALRKAAARLWRHLFARPLPPLRAVGPERPR